MQTEMSQRKIDDHRLEKWRGQFGGEVIRPGDAGYDPTKLFQLNQNIKPAI